MSTLDNAKTRVFQQCRVECTTVSNTRTDDGLILGVARTGAKFTDHNHKATNRPVHDLISSGKLIAVVHDEIAAELEALKALDVKYIHEHARNPVSGEQTAELSAYRAFGELVRSTDPNALVSFGGSRNGPEIADAIARRGELSRIEHASLALSDGGAHFVTTQAAIELQIVTDMERQGFVRFDHQTGAFDVLENLLTYVPSGTVEGAALEVHSTAGGGSYGASSAAVQMETLKWTIDARMRLGLPYEVEWVQKGRSVFLTWYLANVMPAGLRRIGRLNITILFGFSPKLPFPRSYREFRSVVETARNIVQTDDRCGMSPLRVSVSVGAAILPQHAIQHVQPMDCGPLKGKTVGPMERLALYSAQTDSGVDILRVGLEDTPYMVDFSGRVVPATNALLVERTRSMLDKVNANVISDPAVLAAFASLPKR